MQNALASVVYADGSTASISMRNPETWWPIDQDYMIDDYMLSNDAPLPPRVDLASGRTRILDPIEFKGKGGRDIAGGAATILYMPLDRAKTAVSLKFEVSLYPMVGALLGRPWCVWLMVGTHLRWSLNLEVKYGITDLETTSRTRSATGDSP